MRCNEWQLLDQLEDLKQLELNSGQYWQLLQELFLLDPMKEVSEFI
jgi:hypothetical protein